MQQSTKTSRNLFKTHLAIAKKLIEKHIVNDEGQACFNLFTYLEALPVELESVQIDNFAIDSVEIARYLWCGIAIEEEGNPYPETFRGMPVLD